MILDTPGTLRKPVTRDLYLATSSAAKPPHRGKGHCLLFIINAYAAATPMGSRDEQQPPCAKQKARLCPKEPVIAYVWDRRCPRDSLGDKHGGGEAVPPRVMCANPLLSQLRVIQICAKGRGRSAGSVFENLALLSLSGFLFFLLPSLLHYKEQHRRKQERICLKIWQASDSGWWSQPRGSRGIQLPSIEGWGGE